MTATRKSATVFSRRQAFSVSDLSANDAGMLGFQSTLNAGSLAIFVGTSGATAQMLAQTGDPVPGTGGANILLITDNPSINASGQAVFNVVLSGGVDSNAIVAVPEAGATASTLAVLGLLAVRATRSNRSRRRRSLDPRDSCAPATSRSSRSGMRRSPAA